ncbi:MAG: amidohydrolase family protein [Betaproteobacteria bacterium]|nr:amidohydrolase family protein [Betaproteobacteria bacterium]
MHDLVIRDARVVDGSGRAAFDADVGISGSTIMEIGSIKSAAKREIRASGRYLMPGWVDIHTHYDGQALWDPYLSPSGWHGVTTAIMGNCGVGFAPLREIQRDWAIELMEGVEDIPGAVLREGVRFTWEDFPGYLDALDQVPHAMDIGTQVPHAAVRVYVMGDRGRRREKASSEDLQTMKLVVKQAIEAGALGFSSSRALVHKSSRGEAVPSLDVSGDEYRAIAYGLAEAGKGVVQMISDFSDLHSEFGIMKDAAAISGRPLSFTLLEQGQYPDRWREILGMVGQAQAQGLNMRAQVASRPIGLMLGLQCSMSPFMNAQAYRALAHLDLPQRVAALRDPTVKAAILADTPTPDTLRLQRLCLAHDRHFPLHEHFTYEPEPSESVAALAQAEARDPREFMYDFMLKNEGKQLFYFPLHNYEHGDLESVRTMMTHPYSLLGLGDGGAHNGYICDSSFPTFLITHWARDRKRGAQLRLEDLVRAQSYNNAQALGLRDRGLIATGMKADLNLVDFERLRLTMPEQVSDLPGGGRRFIQRSEGYDYTLVSGVMVYEHGQATGAMPGRLIRGARVSRH